MLLTTYIWLYDDGAEKNVKRLSKCENEENGQRKNLEKSGDNLLEHDDVNSKLWLKSQEEHKVEPAEEDAQCSQLPAPAVEASELAVAHEGDGGDVQEYLNIVEKVCQVLPWFGH